jgi:formylglycine-generating enzyme required for sulfatase activity
MISRALIVLLGVTALGGCFEDVDLDAICPPDSPGCEAYDYDGDGVANAEDDFPEDADCALRDDDNCAACGVGCVAPQVCDGQGGCSCLDPRFAGTNCDECADPHYALPDCTNCLPQYTGASCDECADPTYTGASCDECADPTYTGASCTECADPTYTGASCDECADPTYTGASCDEVIIPAGTFTMGSPPTEPCRDGLETQHEVTLTQSFSLKPTEVTQAEWQALMGNNPSGASPGCDDCPVETVNWYEALAYCNALSASAGLEACYTLSGCNALSPGTNMTCTGVTVTAPDGDVYGCEGYRLPTESEWEYAARAGTTEATYNGDIGEGDCTPVSPVLEPIAWYSENSSSTTHPVAQKDANPWGLYDMLGNVWEWTWDRKAAYPGDVTDPTGASNGSNRVFRGCCWISAARDCRAAYRFDFSPVYRFAVLGFRPARSLP